MRRTYLVWRNVSSRTLTRPSNYYRGTLFQRVPVLRGSRTYRQYTTSPPWRQDENPQKIKLRWYQQECIEAVQKALAEGKKRLAISIATGGGKTFVFSHLIGLVEPPIPGATKTLILAHRQELVHQAATQCRSLYPNLVVDIDMGPNHASGHADITVASIQSIISGKSHSRRLLNYDPTRFKLLIVDEAHHITAPGYLEVLRHFGLGEKNPSCPTALLGVSATLSRHDGVKLGLALDHIVYHRDYVDMIQDDVLADMVFTTVRSSANLTNVKSSTSTGDFQLQQLSDAVNNEHMNRVVVEAWMAKAVGRKSTLVFCVDLAHVEALTVEFRKYGVDARFVTSDTPTKERNNRLEDFKRRKFPVLINCGIFTEGTDIPNIDCIVMARPTKSQNLLIQMLGRGLRKHPGKGNCHIIDFVSSLETGIVTTPTLFGLDPNEIVDENDFAQMKTLKERRQVEEKRQQQASHATIHEGERPDLQGNITFTDYDNVNDLIDDTSGEKHIRRLSAFSWVQIDDDRYILSNRDGEFVRIQKQDDEAPFAVTITRKLPVGSKSPWARPKQIATAETFEAAVRAADTAASEKFPFDFINKNAWWRKTPASGSQIDYLNKFREDSDKLEYGSINKGKAGDLITKIKHGARGRFKRINAEKKAANKTELKREQWRERVERQQVKVGPIDS